MVVCSLGTALVEVRLLTRVQYLATCGSTAWSPQLWHSAAVLSTEQISVSSSSGHSSALGLWGGVNVFNVLNTVEKGSLVLPCLTTAQSSTLPSVPA